MPSKKCVIGCNTRYDDKCTIRHHFPRGHVICNVWVQKSGNVELLNKSVQHICNSYVMDDKRFKISCKSPGFKKLIEGSIPTRNLPSNFYF